METESSCSALPSLDPFALANRLPGDENFPRGCLTRLATANEDHTTTPADLLGSWFWVEHPTKLWTVARLAEIRAGGENGADGLQANADATCVVEFQDGGFAEMRLSDLRGSVDSPSLLRGVDDLLSLGELTEASLLHSLRTRFFRREIYTAIGTHILVSINPCEPLPSLFDKVAMEACRKAAAAQQLACDLQQGAGPAPGDRSRGEEAAVSGCEGAPGCEDAASFEEVNKPHIFTTAQHAHTRLFREGRSQSIITSGESGSGKTEGTKLILRYLAHLKPLSDAWADEGSQQPISLEERVLNTNPVLEAFGNAKTCQNDNSSRFGKFTLIYFEPRSQRISSACLHTYLLETCRLVRHSSAERNFHVFYQLVDGAAACLSPAFVTELLLSPSSSTASFAYLIPQRSGRREETAGPDGGLAGEAFAADVLDKKKNASEFRELLSCFTHLGFTQDEQENVLRVLAAILHLGNLRFKDMPGGVGPRVLESDDEDEQGDAESESDDEEDPEEDREKSKVEAIARLLCIDAEDLAEFFRVQRFVDPVTRQDLHLPRTAEKAAEVRDMLAKFVYNRLFSWLVCRLNRAVEDSGLRDSSPSLHVPPSPFSVSSARENVPPSPSGAWDGRSKFARLSSLAPGLRGAAEGEPRLFIGLLDIYGFEVFEENSFEQLCINYANEKLQQHFNHHIFSLEQAAYAAEGIAWEQIPFTDNEAVIDGLERKVTGLFALLDSENIMPKATDRSFLRKIIAQDQGDLAPIQSPANKLKEATHFKIVHYAGPVEYSVDGFLEKNRSSCSREIADLIRTTGSPCLEESSTLSLREDDLRHFSSTSTTSLGRGVSTGFDGAVGTSRRLKQSVSAVFKEQVRGLLSTIAATDPFYVRCIKPAAEKGRRFFDAADVLRQLRCAGVLETVRIRRDGYPVRLPFAGFLGLFSCLASEAQLSEAASASPSPAAAAALRSGSRDGETGKNREAFVGNSAQQTQRDRALCENLLQALTLKLAGDGVLADHAAGWQVGKTKVFLKKPLVDALDRVAAQFRFRAATCISRHFRGFVERRRYLQTRATILRLQSRFRGVLRFRRLVREFHERKERQRQALAAESPEETPEPREEAAERDATATNAGDLQGALCAPECGEPCTIRGDASEADEEIEPAQREQEAAARARSLVSVGGRPESVSKATQQARGEGRRRRQTREGVSESSSAEESETGLYERKLRQARRRASRRHASRSQNEDDLSAEDDGVSERGARAKRERCQVATASELLEERRRSQTSTCRLRSTSSADIAWSCLARSRKSKHRSDKHLRRALLDLLLATDDRSESSSASDAEELRRYLRRRDAQVAARRRLNGSGGVLEDLAALETRLDAMEDTVTKLFALDAATQGARDHRAKEARPNDGMQRALGEALALLAQKYLKLEGNLRKLRGRKVATAAPAGPREASRFVSSNSQLPAEAAKDPDPALGAASRDVSRLLSSVLLSDAQQREVERYLLSVSATRQASSGSSRSVSSQQDDGAKGLCVLLALGFHEFLHSSLSGHADFRMLPAIYALSPCNAAAKARRQRSGSRQKAAEGERRAAERSDRWFTREEKASSRRALQPAAEATREEEEEAAACAALAQQITALREMRAQEEESQREASRRSHDPPSEYFEAHEDLDALSRRPSAAERRAPSRGPHAARLLAPEDFPASEDAWNTRAAEATGFWTRLFRRLRGSPVSTVSDDEGDGSGEDEDARKMTDKASPTELLVYRGQSPERETSRVVQGEDTLDRVPIRNDTRDTSFVTAAGPHVRPDAAGDSIATREEFDQLRGKVDTLQQSIGRCCDLLEDLKAHFLKGTDAQSQLQNWSTMGTMPSGHFGCLEKSQSDSQIGNMFKGTESAAYAAGITSVRGTDTMINTSPADSLGTTVTAESPKCTVLSAVGGKNVGTDLFPHPDALAKRIGEQSVCSGDNRALSAGNEGALGWGQSKGVGAEFQAAS
ncbi:myosin I [Besnoitia besnoiti]|uniref:Myosin I n=1 Tax=Besnoitia besnoiti TaxID=94643 RepID=A0A2A9MQS6_BESBE|nr:myosin I [Besnoitia besnoiti]PFH38687.1 myosin I [Besnoitia besnoiti]